MSVLMLEKLGKGLTEFEGAINAQMPVLVGKGLVPATFADVMRLRNEVLQPDHSDDVRRAVWLNYVDTGTGHVRHADGSLVIAERPDYLLNLKPETPLPNGAVPLTDNQYFALRGTRLVAGQVKKHSGRRNRSVSEVLDDLIWMALAGNDWRLLEEYARNTFDLTRKWLGYECEVMDAYAMPPQPAKGAEGSLWAVGRLDGSIYDSGAGVGRLDDYFGLLVGEAPEAQRAVSRQPQALESKI